MGYKLAEFPQETYRFEIYDNAGKLSWQEIKRRTGCHALLNLGYFNLSTFAPEDTLMVDGVWKYRTPWGYTGILTDRDGRLTVGPDSAASWGYCNAEPVYVLGGRDMGADHFGRNGNTMLGVKPDGTVVALLCPKDAGQTSREGVALLQKAGCTDILRFDGSWSSQGSLGPGLDVDPSRERRVRSYLLICKREGKEEEKPVSKTYKVCLDPGHGVETPGKCAPDKSYYEHEFALDLAKRMKAILERHGVAVTLTRQSEHCPTGSADNADLARRVSVANAVPGLDLFVSLHSNAAGNGSQWMSARGYCVYTSAAGETAGRNIAARKVLARVKEAGISVRGTAPLHQAWYVCMHTLAPAILIEHLFHDNREDVALLKDSAFRDRLAVANCKGILDYLGLGWKSAPKPTEPEAPWYAEDRAWAVGLGLTDGTRPLEACTRAEEWTMLRRLYDAIKAGK